MTDVAEYRLWPFTVRDGDGTIAARDAQEARAKVADWAQRNGRPADDITIGEPDLPLGMVDIARRAGVTPDAVKKWRARHADFPRPAGQVAGSPVWWWPPVRQWLHDTSRGSHPPTPDEDRHGPGCAWYDGVACDCRG